MFKILFALAAVLAVAYSGVVPALPYAAAVAPFATSYNAHAVTHSVATPFAAYTAPAVAAPLAYSAHPAAYSAYPYSAYPAFY